MLNLLIFVCLVYVLVRVCLGFWGYILKQSSLCSPVSLCWFPQSATPVSTPNTCIATWSFLGGCQVSHLPLSFFPLSFLCFLFFLFFADALIFNSSGHPMLGERTCANLSRVILCHLVSLCRVAIMLIFFLVMVCDGVDFEHLCLPFFFSPATLGAQNPTTTKGCWVCGRNGLGRKVCPSSLVVGSAALS